MADEKADGYIVVGLDVSESTDLMQKQLNDIGKNLKLNIKAEIDPSVQKKFDQLSKGKVDIKVGTDQATNKIKEVEKSIVSASKQTKSFGDILKSTLNIGSAAAIVAQGFRLIRQATKEAIEAVKEIDAALTQVQIVTGASDAEIKKYASDAAAAAKKIGASIKDVISSTETFARLGYSLTESLDLSSLVGKYANVAATTVDDATESLTAIMKAFNYTPAQMEGVVDELVKVGQEYAVSAAELGQALQNGGAALEAGGNTLEESIALIAAGNAAVQNASTVGNALKTVSMRVRSSTAELEAMGETVDDLVKSTADYRAEIMALSGVDIMIDDSTYKSTYQILQEIAKVWDTLSDIDQAALLEDLAGKRNANTVKSVITNLKDLEGAYQSASNATGTLAVANETYMDSIEAKTKVLQASFEQLSIDTIDSGLVKGILDAANALVVLLDKTNLVKSALAGLIVGGAIKGITAIATGITKATIQMNQFNAALGMLKAGNLGEAEFAQLVKLTGQLSAAQLKAVVSSQALTAEQRLAILTATGMSEAEAAQTLATMGLATAEGTATAATFSLSAAFTALKVALAANPILAIVSAISLVTTLLPVAINLFDSLFVSAEKATEQMEESVSEFEEATEHVKDLNKELKTTQERIDELNAKDNLTFVEESELQKLRESVELLQIQADLAEKERVQKAKEAAKNTVTAYRKNFKGNMTQEKVDEYISNANITGNNAILLDSSDDISAMLAGIHQMKELRDEVQKGSDDYIHFQNVIKDTSDVIWDQVRVLTTYKDNLEAIPYDELTEDQKVALDEINEAIKLVYTTLEPDKWKNMQWNSIVNNSAYKSDINALKDLAAEAEITADTIREQFPALVQACEEAGLAIEDVASNLNGSFDRADGGAVSRYTAQLSDLAEVLTDLQDAYDLLETAQKEMADGGGLSVDTIADLADAEENYLDYLYEENGVIKLNTEAWIENANAKMRSEMADIQREIDAIERENDAIREQIREKEALRTAALAAQDLSSYYAYYSAIDSLNAKIDANNELIAENQSKLDKYSVLYGMITGDLEARQKKLCKRRQATVKKMGANRGLAHIGHSPA